MAETNIGSNERRGSEMPTERGSNPRLSLDTLDSFVGCCPTCETAMPIQRVHNGVMWVGHGVCPSCGWASDHADPTTPNAESEG